MSVQTNLTAIRNSLPATVTLVAVSKTHPVEAIQAAYEAGQRIFGENRPQEMAAKQSVLPSDIRWHMIGHLQTNKVRLIAPFVDMIHSVDSERLWQTIDREAARIGRTIDILLELHIAREESKHGWNGEELTAWLDTETYREFTHTRVRGLMGMASYVDDRDQISEEFRGLKALFDHLRQTRFGSEFDTLSMGMSGDYRIAVECGSTMVRIGSSIFGSRSYPIDSQQ